MSDTQTTPAPYTPTPWRWYRNEWPLGEGGAMHLLTDNDLYLEMTYNDPIIFTVRDDWIRHLQKHPEGMGNARLITSAVNSYAKHRGPNAIQCAEDDLLGQALDIIADAKPWLDDLWADGEPSEVGMILSAIDHLSAHIPQQPS